MRLRIFLITNFLICFYLSGSVLALPIPSSKPDLYKLDASYYVQKETTKLVPLPPAVPERKFTKHPQKTTTENTKSDTNEFVIGTRPPPRKPIHIQTIISSVAGSDTNNTIDSSPYDSVTLVFKKPEKMPHVPSNNEIRWATKEISRDSDRWQEANIQSPFKTTRVQKISRNETSDPIIIFFQEGTKKLEVGQIDILSTDILNPLKRNPNANVTIKGYANKNRDNKDQTRKLSLARAMIVHKFLVEHGIKSSRVKVKVMEDNTPIEPKDRADIFLEY